MATDTADFRRRRFTIETPEGKGELAAIEMGDAARPIDIVFMHANGFNALTYRNTLAPLADRLRILAVDQQGHGLSPQRVPSESRTSWLGYRDDLVALLDQLDGQPVILAGHSMGGAVSVMAAAERPGQVKALALFDPVIMSKEMMARVIATKAEALADMPLAAGARRRRAIFPSRAAVIESFSGRGAFKTWPDQALADYVKDGFREREDGQVELTCAPDWEAANFIGQAHDVWAPLHSLRVPVTIRRAEIASTCSVESSDDFTADNPAFSLETIPGTTHFLPIERPDVVREVLAGMA